MAVGEDERCCAFEMSERNDQDDVGASFYRHMSRDAKKYMLT